MATTTFRKIFAAGIAISLLSIFASVQSIAQVKFYKSPNPDTISSILHESLPVPREFVEVVLKGPQTFPSANAAGRYGVPVDYSLPVSRPKQSDSNIWYVRIASTNAKTLDISLSDLKVSPGSALFVYNENRTVVMGPINAENASQGVTTISFPGSVLYIKVVEGQANANSTFRIVRAVHGFSDIFRNNIEPIFPNAAKTTSSGVDCIPDAMCYNEWSLEREMVGLFQINGWAGTGTFMNNEAQDRKPYFLSAFHVADVDDNGSLSAAEMAACSTATVLLDNHTVSCGSSTLNYGTSISGAYFRAAWEPSDFFLMEMYTTPSVNLLVNFAGWDRSTSSPSAGTSLHHPDGTWLRYSASSNVGNNPLYPKCWQVYWHTGVTVPGSSGCALFNQNHQVVGQLWKGFSSCNLTEFGDLYGKLSQSWEGGGTSSTQLKAWLSPSSNLSSIGYLTPLKITGPTSVCYGSTITISMPNLISGESATWSTSGNLSIVSSNSNSVTVTATYSSSFGMGAVTAQFPSGVTVSKNVYYGTPDIYTIKYDGGISTSSLNYVSAGSHTAYIDMTNAIASDIYGGVSWNPSPYIGYSYGQYFGYYDFTLNSGDMVTFNPVSATNACGTSNRTLAFTSPSSFAAYPNPASSTLFVEFNSTQFEETLPEEIQIISEITGKAVKSESPKLRFKSKSFEDGKKIRLDVSSLPKGRYYLKPIYEKKAAEVAPKTELTRILIE
jgi:lysyl endopeptidase